MSDLPEPFTPPDCDLRGYEFVPLFGQRLFGSRFYGLALRNPRAGLSALKLWWEAWQQCPAASLPDDDYDLARMADFGTDVKGWRAVREIALHGFVKCEDGRLYHSMLAKKACAVWSTVLRTRARVIRRLEMTSGEWSVIRMAVFHRDNFTCRYCGDRGGELECDHVMPLSRGGPTKAENLVTACLSKACKTPAEWGVSIQ